MAEDGCSVLTAISYPEYEPTANPTNKPPLSKGSYATSLMMIVIRSHRALPMSVWRMLSSDLLKDPRGTEGLQTPRWREQDSNPRSHGYGELGASGRARRDPPRPARSPGWRAWRRALGERFPAYRGLSRASTCWRSDVVTRASGGVPLCLLGAFRDLGRIGLIGPNSGRERDSLIRAKISLIADSNSLQGRKIFPVPMRRELACKALVLHPFLLPLTRSRASNR